MSFAFFVPLLNSYTLSHFRLAVAVPTTDLRDSAQTTMATQFCVLQILTLYTKVNSLVATFFQKKPQANLLAVIAGAVAASRKELT